MGVLTILVAGAFLRLTSKPIGVLLIAPYSGFFLVGMARWYAFSERNRFAAAALALGAVICFALSPLIMQQLPVLPICALMLALYGMGVESSFGPMAWLGRISYSLYLLHQNIGLSVIKGLLAGGIAPFRAVTLSTGGAISVAWIFHHTVEEPTRNAVVRWWNRHESGSTKH